MCSGSEYYTCVFQVAPFIECSSKSRQQLPVCRDADIESYPTWWLGWLNGARGECARAHVCQHDSKTYTPKTLDSGS